MSILGVGHRSVVIRSVTTLSAIVALGCEPHRVEYRTRPAFYRDAAMGELPDRETLPDGTVVIWRERGKSDLERQATSDSEPFKPWDEREDGTIVLRALLPEHVLSNFSECLLRERYDLMYEQMLAEPTKMAYEQMDDGQSQFESYCRKYRRDLRAMINRLLVGKSRNEVIVDSAGGGVIRYRFHPTIGGQFKFQSIDMTGELGGLKLLRVN